MLAQTSCSGSYEILTLKCTDLCQDPYWASLVYVWDKPSSLTREATSELFPTCNWEENCLGLSGRKAAYFQLAVLHVSLGPTNEIFQKTAWFWYPSENFKKTEIPSKTWIYSLSCIGKVIGGLSLKKTSQPASSVHLWTEGFNWYEDRQAFVPPSFQGYIFIHGLRMLCSNITKIMQSLGCIVLAFYTNEKKDDQLILGKVWITGEWEHACAFAPVWQEF